MIDALQRILTLAPACFVGTTLMGHSLTLGGAAFATSVLTHQIAGMYFEEGPNTFNLYLEGVNTAICHIASASIGEPLSWFSAICLRSVITDIRSALDFLQKNMTLSIASQIAVYRISLSGATFSIAYIAGYPISLADSYIISNGIILSGMLVFNGLSTCSDVLTDIHTAFFKTMEECPTN